MGREAGSLGEGEVWGGAEEEMQHLLLWQGCGTMFISVSARRCVRGAGWLAGWLAALRIASSCSTFFIALAGDGIDAKINTA